jgi:hypothetical protein
MLSSLAEELAEILAAALVADVRQFPNLASIEAPAGTTGASPPGFEPVFQP